MEPRERHPVAVHLGTEAEHDRGGPGEEEQPKFAASIRRHDVAAPAPSGGGGRDERAEPDEPHEIGAEPGEEGVLTTVDALVRPRIDARVQDAAHRDNREVTRLQPPLGDQWSFLTEVEVRDHERDRGGAAHRDDHQSAPELRPGPPASGDEEAQQEDRDAHHPDRAVVERAEEERRVDQAEPDRVGGASAFQPAECEQEAERELSQEQQLQVALMHEGEAAERVRHCGERVRRVA